MSQTLVIKIGTSSLTKPETGNIALNNISALVETLHTLKQLGHKVILVSSGAVGIGCQRLGIDEKPQSLSLKQAISAVGQGRLIRLYDELFEKLGQPIAQVLLTRRELGERIQYSNILNTFQELLQLGVIPIVNENDTVTVGGLQLKFGDNDTLAAMVASSMLADWLFLLTDVDQLYSADPRKNADASPIPWVQNLTELEEWGIEVGQPGSSWGTGGMATKITAAQIATAAGVKTVITEGRAPYNIIKILSGEPLGTQFVPFQGSSLRNRERKRWIAHGLVMMGKLYLDEGAVTAIVNKGKSLLAAGIMRVEGEFLETAGIQLCDRAGKEIARGLTNYSSEEIQLIKGKQSQEIPLILSYDAPVTVVHRDNLYVTA